MICPPCREGGRTLTPAPHRRCRAITSGQRTWCDCAHDTVSSLNPLLVPRPKGQDSE